MSTTINRRLNYLFDELNAELFNQELQRPQIVVGSLSHPDPRCFGCFKPAGPTITLHPRVLRWRGFLIDAMLHEVTHQLLWQRGQTDRDSGGHGQQFLNEAVRINQLLGLASPRTSHIYNWPTYGRSCDLMRLRKRLAVLSRTRVVW